MVEVWAPESVAKVTFNGAPLDVTKSNYGTLVGRLGATEVSIESVQSQLPALSEWKVAKGLPEADPKYDDSRWTGQSPLLSFSLTGSDDRYAL